MSAFIKTALLILLAVAAFLCFAGCKAKPRATPSPPTVEVAPVTQADVPIYHEWIGTLDGLVNATIRAQVTGYLLAQDYREGDAIKKGDLLFEIDPRPFQAALDQANGQLAEAEARLGKTELDVKRYAPAGQGQGHQPGGIRRRRPGKFGSQGGRIVGASPGGAGPVESGLHQDRLAH